MWRSRRAGGRLIAVLWAVCALHAPGARAAEPGPGSFAHYGQEDGLPHNTVTDLLEDRAGFLWMATDDGAARADGLCDAGAFEVQTDEDVHEIFGGSNGDFEDGTFGEWAVVGAA